MWGWGRVFFSLSFWSKKAWSNISLPAAVSLIVIRPGILNQEPQCLKKINDRFIFDFIRFEILTQLNCVGAEVTDYKKLRDVEWSNLRRAAEKKLATFKANQEKPLNQAQPVVFTQAEEIVLDVLGKGKLFFSYNP